MISNKVMKLNEDYYRVACKCGILDHDLGIFFDQENGDLIFIKTLSFKSSYTSWWNSVIERVKTAFTVLFKGWIEVEEEMLLERGEHIENFIEVLRRFNART